MISRPALLTGGPLALAARVRIEGSYFGRTPPPNSQKLFYLIGAEPTSLHPASGEPMAGLATCYKLSPDGGLLTAPTRTCSLLCSRAAVRPTAAVGEMKITTACLVWPMPNQILRGMLKVGRLRTTPGGSMPIIPLYLDVWIYLQKPFVRGPETDPLPGLTFHTAWIDTAWRPE